MLTFKEMKIIKNHFLVLKKSGVVINTNHIIQMTHTSNWKGQHMFNITLNNYQYSGFKFFLFGLLSRENTFYSINEIECPEDYVYLKNIFF